MKQYSRRDLQLKLLELTKFIDKICKENDIEYYLIYGSALGAIRHKGFIPWDDDVDIGMTYENFLKFKRVYDEKIDKSKYFLQDMDSEPNYYLSFMKFRDLTTTLIEEGNKNIDITYGVYVDIFPFVGVPDNKIKRKLLEINRAFALSANINVINNKYLYLIFRFIIKIFGKKRILKYCTKKCLKYSCNDYDVWCSIFDGDGIENSMVTREAMGKPKYVKFEDTKLPIPANADEHLTRVYGDYMKIPSPEQIKKSEHTAYVLDLEHSYSEYLALKKDDKNEKKKS